MSRERRTVLCLTLLGLGLAATSTIGAQDLLDEVIVSARKRDENAQVVPISLSVRPGGELEARNEVRIQDILRVVPNVSTDITQPRTASIAIRGLGRSPPNDGLESSVGVFVDGVYYGRSGMMVGDFIDLERVEVLRGPQGTLFGKNATAGAINIVTREPAAATEAWLEATVGEYSLHQAKGSISLPLVERELGLRINGSAVKRHGFTRNVTTGSDVNDLERGGARADLLWRPGEVTKLRLLADYNSQDEVGPGYLLVDPAIQLNDGSVRADNVLTRTARAGYTPRFAPFDRQTDADAPMHMIAEQAGASLQADIPLGAHRITSISAWRKWNFRPENDGDLLSLDIQPTLGSALRSSQWSQELRLNSPDDTVLRYVVGLFVFDQSIRSEFLTVYGADAADYMMAGLPAYVLDGFTTNVVGDPQTRSYAGFGQASWLPDDRIEVTAGLRWTTESRDASIIRTSWGGSPLAADDVRAAGVRARFGSPATIAASRDEDFLSGVFSASWRPNNALMLYLSAARGAKSGGINITVIPAGLPQTIDPEIATNFELGMKGQWMDHRLQVNVSAFSTKVEDFQATIREPVRGAAILANAGDVLSRGMEVEASWRPVESLALSLATGWNDAHYTSFTGAPCPPEAGGLGTCDFSGERVVGAPADSTSFNADWHTPLPDGDREFFASLEYLNVGAYRSELPRSTRVPGYDLVNVRLGLRANDDWSATLWVQNLLDMDYFTTLSAGGGFNVGMAYGLVGAPRTCGVTLRKQF
jgi:iron complex outermembrane receptor protein